MSQPPPIDMSFQQQPYYPGYPAQNQQQGYGDGFYDQYYINTMPQDMHSDMHSEMQTGFQTDMQTNYTDEPPLLEELEINLDHIRRKTWAVMTFRSLNNDKNILQDPDLAGPLVFLLTFGFLLLLSVAARNISFMCTVSVLGYCLLPMVILSGLSILINLKATLIGNILAIVAILWCAIGASNLLVTAIDITNAKLLIAYPCALFYTVFALLTVF